MRNTSKKRPNSGARRLRAWRAAQRLSQPEAALALGVMNFLTVSRWERGVSRPRRASAVLIFRVTDGYVPIEAWDGD